MLNWYKINLFSKICLEQRQLLCIPDKVVRIGKPLQPRRRATSNCVSNHCCAHLFIWKCKSIKSTWILAILLFSCGNCPLLRSSSKPHFSCATVHKQDGMDRLGILNQKSRDLVFLMLSMLVQNWLNSTKHVKQLLSSNLQTLRACQVEEQNTSARWSLAQY